MKHIVSYSGGIGSYMAANRVVEQYGAKNTLLVFTDTKIEDEDLYRFIDETAKDLGAEFLKLEEGRDVWQVFFDEKYLGNSRFGNCTKRLKQEPFRSWLEDNYKSNECVIYLGIDWSEEHRYKKALPYWGDYTLKAPMCDAPYLSKEEMLNILSEKGIEIPRLYKMGFSHNNCGGFCVKAGQAHFANLLKQMPDRYLYHEKKELEWQRATGRENTILRIQSDGERKKLSLRDLRIILENNGSTQIDLFDFGGCGCFTDYE